MDNKRMDVTFPPAGFRPNVVNTLLAVSTIKFLFVSLLIAALFLLAVGKNELLVHQSTNNLLAISMNELLFRQYTDYWLVLSTDELLVHQSTDYCFISTCHQYQWTVCSSFYLLQPYFYFFFVSLPIIILFQHAMSTINYLFISLLIMAINVCINPLRWNNKMLSISESRTLQYHIQCRLHFPSFSTRTTHCTEGVYKGEVFLWNMFLAKKCVVCRRKKATSKCSSSRISFLFVSYFNIFVGLCCFIFPFCSFLRQIKSCRCCCFAGLFIFTNIHIYLWISIFVGFMSETQRF